MSAAKSMAKVRRPGAAPPQRTDAVARPPPRYGVQQADSPVAREADSLSGTVESTIRALEDAPSAQRVEGLRRLHAALRERLTTGEAWAAELMANRAESFGQYLAGGLSELLGGASLPPDHWPEPWAHLTAAEVALGKGQIVESGDHLRAAGRAVEAQWRPLSGYAERVDKGSARAVTGLRITAMAGGVAASALTGGLGGLAVGTAYGAAQNVAEQAAGVVTGTQRSIDWAGIGFDTLIGALTGAMGGRLGKSILAKLLAKPKTAPLGRKVLANAVSELISGRSTLILHSAAKALFDQARGRPMTLEAFSAQLIEQLTDPESMFMDGLGGAMGRGLERAKARRVVEPAALKGRPRRTKSTTSRKSGAARKSGKPKARPTGEGSQLDAGGPEPVEPARRARQEAPVTLEMGRAWRRLTAGGTLGANSAMKTLWEAASPRHKASKAWHEKLPSLSPQQAREKVFDPWRRRFWRLVRRSELRKDLEAAGWDFTGKDGSAPVHRITGERLTLDHVARNETNPTRTVDPDNLRFSPGSENSNYLNAMEPHLGVLSDPWPTQEESRAAIAAFLADPSLAPLEEP